MTMSTSVIHLSYNVKMSTESVIHATTLSAVPKQTRPRMVPLSFRATQTAKEQGYAKAARLGLNPTEVMRDLWTEWAESEDEA